jgi:diguanylate cyclase (GGDEF)-like protein
MTDHLDPDTTIRVLVVPDPTVDWGGALAQFQDSVWGAFRIERSDSRTAATQRLAQEPFDAVVAAIEATQDDRLPMWPGLSHATVQAAVVVVSTAMSASRAARLVAAGVQDTLPLDQIGGGALARSVRMAVERHRLGRNVRKAFASDLSTGLPNHQQLIEHMSQLLALRQRQPALMALLVIRLEGLTSVEAVLGAESANVLRRKVAVRLRSAVRSSDVVVALSGDAYGVLLASIMQADDAGKVGVKLVDAVRSPFTVAGRDVALAATVGVARFPEDGNDADELISRAMGLAASTAAVGRGGFVHRDEGGGAPPDAANDEEG